ncbi:S8 family peptidase [Metabacillus sp. RGM 3146]|uniref:S8 family peptidase n=1 Tax=Metabacillus sp. RGM 3146 TaxID=3401092 RepID=UPI003B9BC90D
MKKSYNTKAVSKEESWWDTKAVNAPLIWNKGYTGKGTKVAVIDSGIGPHSDLNVAGGISTVDYTTSYKDDNGHGTHVAGIIAARHNGIGTVGVAPDAELYAVKAMDQDGNGTLESILKGIDWAIQNHMNIINMSFGTKDDSKLLHEAVDSAFKKGILVVAAAGNEGNAAGTGNTMDYPALYDSVIAVSAVDQKYTRGSFSSTGSKVEFAAPGVDIPSTYLNNQYAYLSGTSMATPHITGMLAVLKQHYPLKTNAELRQLLQSYTTDLGTAGRDSIYGYGFARFSQELSAPPVSQKPLSKLDLAKKLTSIAENTLSKTDINAAQQAVNQLPRGYDKNAMQYKLNVLKYF